MNNDMLFVCVWVTPSLILKILKTKQYKTCFITNFITEIKFKDAYFGTQMLGVLHCLSGIISSNN
jgi:hypothetical protein